MQALHQNAVSQLRVNGKVLGSMNPVVLRANDRIAIGPSALFLYKCKAMEASASMPDTPENPITFDFADEELLNNEGEKFQQEV